MLISTGVASVLRALARQQCEKGARLFPWEQHAPERQYIVNVRVLRRDAANGGIEMLVQIVLPAILVIIMFSLGLGLTWADFARVAAEPRAFAVGAVTQVVLVPLAALAVALGFGLPPALAVGVLILGFCPGGVLANVASKFANGNVPLSISLTAVTSLVAILIMPVAVALSVRYFMGADAPPVNITLLGLQVFFLAAVPVVAGIVVTRLLPSLVARYSGWVTRIAFGLFAVLIVAALASNWSVFTANFWTLGPALIVMNALLLIIGLVAARVAKLGIPDATTVALEAGIQNGTLGIAVGMLVAGSGNTELFPPYTLPTAIYSITVWLLTLPFAFWRRSLRAAVGQVAAAE
jgi:BASS family bile acid:Na+ symporter